MTAKWTFMVYIAGDNNLDPAALDSSQNELASSPLGFERTGNIGIDVDPVIFLALGPVDFWISP